MTPTTLQKVTEADLRALGIRLHEQGSFALVTGCFDGLHEGHLRLFETARQHASHIVVAANPDSYIMLHKRPQPMVPEGERFLALKNIAGVVEVLPMLDALPCRLIELLRPTCFVVGPDYQHAPQAAVDQIALSLERAACRPIICHDVKTVSSREIYANRISHA